MLASFRQWFRSLSIREKTLILALLWAGLLFWGLTGLSRFKLALQRHTRMRALAREHRVWLEDEPKVNKDLVVALERMDASKTFRRDRLVGKVDSLARESSMTFELSAPKTENNGIFVIHSVRINFKDARLEDLIEFYEKVRKEAPYIGFETVNFMPERMDPAHIRAQYVISSFELVQKGTAP